MHVRKLAVMFSLFLIIPVAQAFAADKYDEALKVFRDAGESGKFFDKSYGYALFPTIGEGAVGIGGAHGDGRVYQGGKHVGDTKVSQITVGIQLGGKSYSQIIFFEDKRAFDEFTTGNFEFGAEAQAVFVTSAASAEGSTTGSSASASGSKDDAKTAGGYYKGMATFQVAKGGLMGGVSVGGQKFSYTAK
jgi:lipid-binding SYLF domain-containing protein